MFRWAVFAVLVTLPFGQHAQAQNFRGGITDAARTALAGREAHNFYLDGHGFHVKPVQIVRQGNEVRAYGQISHKLRNRPDDQVYFEIVRRPGQPAQFRWCIKRGSFRVAGPLREVVARVVGSEPLLALSAFERLNARGWENSARRIVLAVGEQLR